MQLIFVVEASKESQSDFYYISETLKRFYDTLGHKITPVYMNGKGNYDKKTNEILKDISKYTGVSKVFICYDIDNPCKPTYHINPKIEAYAKNNNFKTIWFNEDIEMAYIKKSVHQSEKTEKAIQFVTHKDIDTIIESDLSQTIISQKNSSNILTMLDSYLKRK